MGFGIDCCQTLPGIGARVGGPHFWQSLVKVNPMFQEYTERCLGDGATTLFWEDI